MRHTQRPHALRVRLHGGAQREACRGRGEREGGVLTSGGSASGDGLTRSSLGELKPPQVLIL